VTALDPAVGDYLDTVSNTVRRRDADVLIDSMRRTTGLEPVMWGTSIIGFGSYHYKYESGREGDAPAIGFSARKQASTIYLADGIGAHSEDLVRLGPHSTGVGCLYVKDLDKVDLAVLESILSSAYNTLTKTTYGHRARDSSS
jgi:hypothetical protein